MNGQCLASEVYAIACNGYTCSFARAKLSVRLSS